RDAEVRSGRSAAVPASQGRSARLEFRVAPRPGEYRHWRDNQERKPNAEACKTSWRTLRRFGRSASAASPPPTFVRPQVSPHPSTHTQSTAFASGCREYPPARASAAKPYVRRSLTNFVPPRIGKSACSHATPGKRLRRQFPGDKRRRVRAGSTLPVGLPPAVEGESPETHPSP